MTNMNLTVIKHVLWLSIFFPISGLFATAWAQKNSALFPLNRIEYQVQAQRWISSQNAKAIITVNWVNNSGQNVAQLRQNLIHNLNNIVPGVWHITHFSRIKMDAGLQKGSAEAEISAPIQKLDRIYQRADQVSRPGQTYRVQSLDFNVSQMDIMNAKRELRQKIYKSISAELKSLARVYPKQYYFVHQIIFTDNPVFAKTHLMQMIGGSNQHLGAISSSSAFASAPSATSQQIRITATVVLSSKVSV